MAEDIDVAGAIKALEESGGMPDEVPSVGPDPFLVGREQADEPAPTGDPDPAEAGQGDTEVEGATPEETPADDTPQFTGIDESVLSPEMKQMRDSMQADYTRKTQEIASWRKLSEELGVESPDEFREALQVYNQLRDPRNWPTIRQELTDYMVNAGMSVDDARAAADEQLETFAPDIDFPDDDGSVDVASPLNALNQKIEALNAKIESREREQAQADQMRAIAEGLTKQELKIRADNPSYSDGDIELMYRMMGDDLNLFDARDQFESIVGGRVASVLTSKMQTKQTEPTPVPGGGVVPAETRERPTDLDASHREAMEFVARLEQEESQA